MNELMNNQTFTQYTHTLGLHDVKKTAPDFCNMRIAWLDIETMINMQFIVEALHTSIMYMIGVFP